MAVTVVDFSRSARRRPDGPMTCPCGSQWFELRQRPTDPDVAQHGAVTLSNDGRVTAYLGEPCCIECGCLAESGVVADD